MPRSPKLNRIKALHCYTIPEAAKITGVSERTIRAWITQGLVAMNDARPILIRHVAMHP